MRAPVSSIAGGCRASPRPACERWWRSPWSSPSSRSSWPSGGSRASNGRRRRRRPARPRPRGPWRVRPERMVGAADRRRADPAGDREPVRHLPRPPTAQWRAAARRPHLPAGQEAVPGRGDASAPARHGHAAPCRRDRRRHHPLATGSRLLCPTAGPDIAGPLRRRLRARRNEVRRQVLPDRRDRGAQAWFGVTPTYGLRPRPGRRRPRDLRHARRNAVAEHQRERLRGRDSLGG